jgi:hypothetical protein
MSLDIVGPSSNAPNVVTTRPAETRVFAVDDTWFKDCTSQAVNDGTKIQAAFLNGLIAQVRKTIRGNGLNGSSQAIVPEDNTDDNMMLRAIWHLIQRAQPTYADGVGSGNAVTIAPTPACNEYVKGLTFRIKWPADCASGAVTVAASGLPPVNVVRTSGANPIAGDLVKDMIVEVTYDGSRFQIMGSPPNVLAAPRTYYVNGVTGSDANSGLLPGAAFASIQKAVNASAVWNLNGFGITISIADYSNYARFTLPAVNGTGTISLVGNVASPDNVAVVSAAGSAVTVYGGPYVMSGVKVSAAAVLGGDPGSGILVQPGGNILLGAMAYGACVGSHVETDGGAISINGPIYIRGGALAHLRSQVNGSVVLNPLTAPALTISAPVTFSDAFAVSGLLGVLYDILGFSSITGAANVSGSKFNVNQNGIIAVNGLGDNYFPGTIAGSRSSGGQYN